MIASEHLRLVTNASHSIIVPRRDLVLQTFPPSVKIKRLPSQTAVAIRQRKKRRKRKHGLRAYTNYLLIKHVEDATRARLNLPPGAKVTATQIQSMQTDLLEIGMLPWLRLFKKRHT